MPALVVARPEMVSSSTGVGARQESSTGTRSDNRGVADVVHRSLRQTHCGRRVGRKKKGWRIRNSDEDAVLHGVGDRRAAP